MSYKKLTVFATLLFGLWVPLLGANDNLSKLEREIRHELVTLPYYSVFDDLNFQLSGSTVILSGEVTRPTLRSDAEAVVRNIAGVTSVENQIEVLPLSSHDDEIRAAAYRAIYFNPYFTRYAIRAVPSIHIIVNRGHVRLTGVVDSEADKNFAGIRINGVAGVFSVKNDLRVVKD